MSAAVVIMAGGTGGHVFPALAVAEGLRARGLTVSWLGTRRGLEAELVPAAGYEIDWLSIAGLRGNGLAGWLLAPLRLGVALLQAAGALRRRRPVAVLGMGGFASGPGGVAARLLAIPLVIHEQNAVAGLTNRWLARVAGRVLEAFPGTFPPA
ncbi:MAG TPA: glycosyltransferase, partial [Gammaproteobacteria bacterium]